MDTFPLFLHLCLLLFCENASCFESELRLSMPLAKPDQPETYLCAPTKLNSSSGEPLFLTGFETLADERVAHHVVLFGCRHPGKQADVFNCGEMERGSNDRGKGKFGKAYLPCGRRGGAPTILYAWTSRATPLTLPPDVAFRVGGDSGVDWLVLQVHYASVSHLPEEGDDTTVVVTHSTEPRSKTAGVLLMATGGRLPGKERTAMEVACELTEEGLELHPMAFRVHTHSLGVDVHGWKVVNGGEKWLSIGHAHPQFPQVFNMISEQKKTEEEREALVLRTGDTLAARCTMVNYLGDPVSVGPASDDEMCNFYLMFWVEGGRLPKRRLCWSSGPPLYSLAGGRDGDQGGFGAGLSNVPEVYEGY